MSLSQKLQKKCGLFKKYYSFIFLVNASQKYFYGDQNRSEIIKMPNLFRRLLEKGFLIWRYFFMKFKHYKTLCQCKFRLHLLIWNQQPCFPLTANGYVACHFAAPEAKRNILSNKIKYFFIKRQLYIFIRQLTFKRVWYLPISSYLNCLKKTHAQQKRISKDRWIENHLKLLKGFSLKTAILEKMLNESIVELAENCSFQYKHEWRTDFFS